MKSLFIILLLITGSGASFSQSKITSEEAVKHIGDSVLIIDKVYGGKLLNGGATVLSLGGEFPDHLLTIVIGTKDRAKFTFKPEERLIGKRVLVKGKLTENKGRPEIIVSEPRQLSELSDSDPRPQLKPMELHK